MNDLDTLTCVICKRNIREINCFPIWSKIHNEIICSACCLLGVLYHRELITEIELREIPEDIRKEIIRIYDNIEVYGEEHD